MALNGDHTASMDLPTDSLTTTTSITTTTAAPSKRKRDDDSSINNTNKQIQFDLLQVLNRHDTSPSFLHHPLRPDTATVTSTATSPSEPSHKKARLSDDEDDEDISTSTSTSTIAAKLTTATYTSLQSLRADAGRVSEDLISAIRSKYKDNKDNKDSSHGGRPSVEDLKLIQRIQYFETMLRGLVDTEDQQQQEKEEENAAHGSGQLGTVLTLFGNAPTPKQLFSSVQKQNLDTDRKHLDIKVELPVEEMNLPNGITATKIVPVRANDGEKGPTFEETFPPPYNLAPLQPPTAHKRSTTRDTTLKWEFKDPIQRKSRKGGYTVQSLTVGKWLGYGGVDPLGDVSSQKQKQRHRALSGGEDRESRPTQAAVDDARAKEEAALFRRAYSSYAPSCDNGNVVVPEVEKNNVWWSRVGHQRFNHTFAIDPALRDEQIPIVPPFSTDDVGHLPVNDEELEQVIANLDEMETLFPSLTSPTDSHSPPLTSKTDIAHVQHRISELLETLASHQRIRNAILPPASASRVPISPAPISSTTGKPDEPSEDERATYEKLRREIAYLVLKLPPYAVAKLDGDQLADLGVSTLVTFHSPDVRGSLEEDLVTRQAKAAASQSAQSLASLSSRPNSSAGPHYSTTAQRTPAIGQAANTRYGQQYAGRPPVSAPQFPRSTGNQQNYGTPAAPRSSYTASNAYTRPGASQSSYGQTNGSQYYPPQRPLQTSTSFGSLAQFQQPSQQSPRPPTFPPTYPPRSQGVANYPLHTNPPSQQPQQQQGFNRTASPAQQQSGSVAQYSSPMLPAQQHLAAAQQRQQGMMYPGQQQQPQPGSGRATPVNGYPSQPNTPVNGHGGPPRSVAPRPMSATPQPAGTS